MVVITTSGTFVTLLLAFITWNSRHTPYFTTSSKYLLAAGIASLLIAALAAIVVNAPTRIAKINADSLLQLTRDPYWNTPGAVAQNEIARKQAMTLISSGFQNRRKAQFLTLSICAQVLGLSLVALVAVRILF
jgi:hypothetical protein